MTAAARAQAPWTDARARDALRRMFDAAIASADPARVLKAHLPDRPQGRCVVVGAGKAAAAMALAVEAAWPDVPLSGVVVVPYHHGAPTSRIRILEAAHPVPDVNSEAAAREVLAAVKGLTADDLALVLISGGGSAVMALPVDGVTLADKQAVTRALLASGLDIRTMNAVRRRLSAIKGGKLAAAAAPARVVTLAISDIPGDDPSAIASGPTIADPDSAADLSAVADRLAGRIPEVAAQRLRTQEAPPRIEVDVDFRMIATPAGALEAAARVAREAGVDVEILGDDLEGESRDVAADMARRLVRGRRPKVLLSGGETTVTLDGSGGRGGRNTEFVLAMALALEGAAGIWALAGDTDGEDGASGGAAGAIIAPDTLARGRAAGLNAHFSLDGHDSGGYFGGLGDLIVTGPTRTNVNDFRAVLVVPPEAL